MDGRIQLILGGARSGKSAWAQRVAEQSGRSVIFVATATAGDAEMAERIAIHRSTRPPTWRTLESPEQLLAPISQHAVTGDVVLVDCLTLWVSNVILRRLGGADPDQVPSREWSSIERHLVGEIGRLVDWVETNGVAAIIVSNEVGMGIVPAFPLGRRYRDALGQVNRAVATRAGSDRKSVV